MKIIGFSVLALFLTVNGFADTLYLKNGGKIQGRIAKESGDIVTWDMDGSSVDFSRSEIERIEVNVAPVIVQPEPVVATPATSEASEVIPAAEATVIEKTANTPKEKPRAYKVPKNWISIPPPHEGTFGYKTQENANDGLKIVILPWWLPGKTTVESANRSIQAYKANKHQLISGPILTKIGSNPVTKATLKNGLGQTVEQYTFRHANGTTFEVLAIGSKKGFEKDRESLEGFLQSFVLN